MILEHIMNSLTIDRTKGGLTNRNQKRERESLHCTTFSQSVCALKQNLQLFLFHAGLSADLSKMGQLDQAL